MTNDTMRAPCGIDCAACAIHIAAQDPVAAEKLAEEWCAGGMEKAEAGWFVCRGCRGDRSLCWCDDCGIYACAVEQRGLDFCSQCGEFPCRTYLDWIGPAPHHQAAFEWLKTMREQG
jgi:hypothetical protein